MDRTLDIRFLQSLQINEPILFFEIKFPLKLDEIDIFHRYTFECNVTNVTPNPNLSIQQPFLQREPITQPLYPKE